MLPKGATSDWSPAGRKAVNTAEEGESGKWCRQSVLSEGLSQEGISQLDQKMEEDHGVQIVDGTVTPKDHGSVDQAEYFGLCPQADGKLLKGCQCVGEDSKRIVKKSVA